MSEKGDLEYRRQQLKRLQEEVVDMEDMTDGISIMDLGLNDFRMALLNYMKEHPDIENAPCGMHTVVPATDELPAGVIFILKNIHNEINRNDMNRLHPFYLVYMAEDGETVIGHLAVKKILDTMRLLCSGEDKPLADLYNSFNKETNGGYDMEAYSDLLSMAVESIISATEDNKVTSFIKGKQMSFFSENISGLNDFELIGFIVVKE